MEPGIAGNSKGAGRWGNEGNWFLTVDQEQYVHG